jgi:endoglucanase
VKGKETIYMLVVPDQKDRSETVQVEVGKSVTSVTLYRPVKGQDNMAEETVSVTDGKISATATETPLFVRVDAN